MTRLKLEEFRIKHKRSRFQEKQKSFLSFGFSAEAGGPGASPTNGASPSGARRSLGGPDAAAAAAAAATPTSGPSVNVTPSGMGGAGAHDLTQDTPEIRKYKKRFNSEILCAALWGVNLLIGAENGLMLLDRSGQGKVYQVIQRRLFTYSRCL